MLLALTAGQVQAFHHLDKGDTFEAVQAVADADVETFAALVLRERITPPVLAGSLAATAGVALLARPW